MIVSVESAGFNGGNIAKILVNDVKIYVEENESNDYRGLHIVVLNSSSGKVAYSKAFDTHKSSKAFEDFIQNQVPEDYIIIAACKDVCVTNLSQKGK